MNIKERFYRVRPWTGGWGVFANTEEVVQVTEPLRTQGDAVIHAKELAHRGDGAQILVYDEEGKLVSEFFYQPEEREALSEDDSLASIAASRPARRRPRPST